MTDLSIIVPCFHEEESLKQFYKEMTNTFDPLAIQYEFLFINDGSKDNTFKILKELAATDSKVKVINFSRNFGKEAAMLAGLSKSKGNHVLILDADLQHPPETAKEMFLISYENEDVDTVIAKRFIDQEKKYGPKSLLRTLFYKIINKLSDVNIIDGVGDFRVLKRYVVDAILDLPEQQRFSKGIFEWVGFNRTYVEFHVQERYGGESRWSTKDLIKYATDGILAFSIKPLKVSLWLGIILAFTSIIYMFYTVIDEILNHKNPDGYSTIISIELIGFSMTLIVLGVIGEYIARIYIESKNRPQYIIKEHIDND